MEHKFSKEQERGTTLGLDGASDQVRNHRDRVRNPGDIHRGRLRQNVFQLQEGLDSNITGAVVPDGQGGMELNEVVEPSVEDAAARPSFSFATGRSVDLEGQRREQHQRRTVYSSADART